MANKDKAATKIRIKKVESASAGPGSASAPKRSTTAPAKGKGPPAPGEEAGATEPLATETKAADPKLETFSYETGGGTLDFKVPVDVDGPSKLEIFLKLNSAVPFLAPAVLEGAALAMIQKTGHDPVSSHLLALAATARQVDAAQPGATMSAPAAQAVVDPSQRQANVASALALIKKLSLDGTMTPPNETAEWFESFEQVMNPFKDAYRPNEWEGALASNAILCMDGTVRQTMGQWIKDKKTSNVSWPDFKAHVLSKFAPQNWAMQAVIAGVLQPCPHKHGGVVARMCTEWLSQLEKMLTPEALRIVEKENPAALCAMVRTFLVPCFGKGAEKKLQDSRHLAKRLERDAKAEKGEPGDATGTLKATSHKEPYLDDIQTLLEYVQPKADAKGHFAQVKCVAAAVCTNCSGPHAKDKSNGTRNCKVGDQAGHDARKVINKQAAARFASYDKKARQFSQRQKGQYNSRRDEHINAVVRADAGGQDAAWVKAETGLTGIVAAFSRQPPNKRGANPHARPGYPHGAHGAQASESGKRRREDNRFLRNSDIEQLKKELVADLAKKVKTGDE